jgi:hypothetical protein
VTIRIERSPHKNMLHVETAVAPLVFCKTSVLSVAFLRGIIGRKGLGSANDGTIKGAKKKEI